MAHKNIKRNRFKYDPGINSSLKGPDILVFVIISLLGLFTILPYIEDNNCPVLCANLSRD